MYCDAIPTAFWKTCSCESQSFTKIDSGFKIIISHKTNGYQKTYPGGGPCGNIGFGGPCQQQQWSFKGEKKSEKTMFVKNIDTKCFYI